MSGRWLILSQRTLRIPENPWPKIFAHILIKMVKSFTGFKG